MTVRTKQCLILQGILKHCHSAEEGGKRNYVGIQFFYVNI